MDDIKILIVEDEPIIADDLHFILEEMGYNSTTSVHTGEDAIKFLQNNDTDLVLLDINLAGKVDGVQVAEYIQDNKEMPYIFLTSLSDDHTISRVKKTSPAGYMVKPIDEKTLKVNIELALSQYQSTKSKKREYSDVYYVKDKIRMTKIQIDDIICLEASSNYTVLKTSSKKFVISQTLKRVLENLNPEIFVRIHKSYVVNVNKIDYIEDSHVVIGEVKLGISRTYRELFLSRLNTI